jgi:hypothetical protein
MMRRRALRRPLRPGIEAVEMAIRNMTPFAVGHVPKPEIESHRRRSGIDEAGALAGGSVDTPRSIFAPRHGYCCHGRCRSNDG